MPKEDSIIVDSKVKYKGTFDLKLLYKKIREWLLREGYSDPCEGGEKKYSERVKPGGKQIEFVWEAKKGEEAGYFDLNIKLSFFLNALNEVEIEKDGKKIKLDNGEIEVVFNSALVRNANDKWDEGGFMFKIYERYIIGDKIEHFKIELYKDSNKLIDEVKNFFSLYRF